MYLDKILARRSHVDVVLMIRENFILFTPMLHEVAADASGVPGQSPVVTIPVTAVRKLCMEALHQQAQAVEKLGLKVTEDAPAGSFVATGADQDVRGQCLPDTDDPRGPKGK